MYAYFILGWHQYFRKDFESALGFSTKCQDHTPTFVENIILKAKIQRALYLYNQASETLQENYRLDVADRYMINKTAKYMMYNNDIQNGDRVFKEVFIDKTGCEKTIHNL
jgi:N-alpha-acetyltransferase 15/16, NatA auxiliary subunit